jgi:hypothetical protein
VRNYAHPHSPDETMRWILLLIAIVCFAVVLKTNSPTVLGLALAIGGISFLCAGIGFIGARVQSVSQGQSNRELELLVTAKPRATAPGESASPQLAAGPRPPPRPALPSRPGAGVAPARHSPGESTPADRQPPRLPPRPR